MFIEFIKKEKKWLGISLMGGCLLSLGVLLLSFFYKVSGLDSVGIWLAGILSSSGIFPLILVFLGLSLLGGIIGMILIGGLLLAQSQSNGSMLNISEAEDVSHSKPEDGFFSTEKKLVQSPISDLEVEIVLEGISGDIEEFKVWGEEICGFLLDKVGNEQVEEAKGQYEAEMPKLKKWFVRLAREYHPDKNIDSESGQKTEKEEKCKVLFNTYKAIKEQWDAALEGIDRRQQTPAFQDSYSHEEFSAKLEALAKEIREFYKEKAQQNVKQDHRRRQELMQRLETVERRLNDPAAQSPKQSGLGICSIF